MEILSLAADQDDGECCNAKKASKWKFIALMFGDYMQAGNHS